MLFCLHCLHIVDSFTQTVTLGDLNGDGVLDIVSTDPNSNMALVLLGNGDGSFSAKKAFGTGTEPSSVMLGDLNGDGVLDIVSVDGMSDTASVILGNGDGSFRGKKLFSAGDNPRSVKLGDLNGDGILDIVSADRNSDTASVLIGNGDGSFKSKKTFSAGDEPSSVALGDLNGDGVLDIVTTDYNSDTASVFLANTKDGVSPILPFSLKNQADAIQAIPVLKNLTDRLAIQRGQIGAFQSRLTTAISTSKNTALQYQGANSRIEDADIAQESSVLIRQQILQQSASAVLSQANQAPALALKLLKS